MRIGLVWLACLGVVPGIGALAEGEEWVHFGLSGKTVNSIKIDPTNPSIIFAGAEEGLYRTTNGGVGWDTLESDLLYGIKAVAIDRIDPLTIYAVHGVGDLDDGIYRSTDGGGSWELIYGLAYGTSFADYYFRLYAGALDDLGGGGVHLSTDGGASWDTINEGLTNLDVLALGSIYCFADTDEVDLAGTRGGVFRRGWGAPAWIWAGPATNAFMVDFAGASLHPHVYAAYGGDSWSAGVYKSTDMGASWIVKYHYIYTEAVAVNPLNPQAVYAGVLGAGVFRSTNGGENWEAMNQGLSDLDVKELAFSPTDTTWLYAGTEGGGIFRYGMLVGIEGTANDQLSMTKSQLLQNYPNPFSHSTTIPYSVQRSRTLNHAVQGGGAGAQGRGGDLSTYQRINLSIYDLSGRLVHTLIDRPSNHPTVQRSSQVVWDGRDASGSPVSSGVYFYRLTAGRAAQFESTRKMVLIR